MAPHPLPLVSFLPAELVEFGLVCLNYAMFLGGGMVKMPQVIAIIRTKTVKGMSEASLVMEFIACSCFCCYNFLMAHPVRTWGEMALVTSQCAVQIALFWLLGRGELALLPRIFGAVLVLGSLLGLLLGMLPVQYLPVLGLVPAFLGSIARVPQIILNFRQGHTGNQSVITWGLSAAGNAIRVVTTLAGVDDLITLFGHLLAGVLNVTLVLQILFYWQRTQEVIWKDKKTE
mmetsp:Transcript_31957/g.74845  ORF Transcript_31957/g.74845 Transcript_31957/m.74845 type:complete len:231 (+) Transcript_31957:76-768(+)